MYVSRQRNEAITALCRQETQENEAEAVLPAIADFVVAHTWSIWTLSPLVVPLDLENMETSMSSFLRNHRGNLEMITNEKNGEESDPNQSENDTLMSTHRDDGTYVRIFQGELADSTEVPDSGNAEKNDGDQGGREGSPSAKRRKVDSTNLPETNVATKRTKMHLIVDIQIDDEPSAQLICCFPGFVAEDGSNDTASSASSLYTGKGRIQSFDFLLTRGSQSSIEVALDWFGTSGCAIGKAPFSPAVADIAQCMAVWTSEHANSLSGKENNMEGCERQEEASAVIMQKHKPLTLKYAVPSEIANSGLESIALTIPPVALMRLCNDILEARKRRNLSDTTPSKSDEVDNVGFLPIVKGLQRFMRETFRINIEPLHLVNGSCAAAVLGCDGRCKPLCASLLGSVFREIQFMIRNQLPGKS